MDVGMVTDFLWREEVGMEVPELAFVASSPTPYAHLLVVDVHLVVAFPLKLKLEKRVEC